MNYPECPFKAKVVEAFDRFSAGQVVTIHAVDTTSGRTYFQTEFENETSWRDSRFKVIEEPEVIEVKDLHYYQNLFPIGSKFKVVCSNDKGLWAKFGDEYTVGDVIETEDGIVIRTKEDLEKMYKNQWVSVGRCESLPEEEHFDVNTSGAPEPIKLEKLAASVSFDSDEFEKDFIEWLCANMDSLVSKFAEETLLSDYISVSMNK